MVTFVYLTMMCSVNSIYIIYFKHLSVFISLKPHRPSYLHVFLQFYLHKCPVSEMMPVTVMRLLIFGTSMSMQYLHNMSFFDTFLITSIYISYVCSQAESNRSKGQVELAQDKPRFTNTIVYHEGLGKYSSIVGIAPFKLKLGQWDFLALWTFYNSTSTSPFEFDLLFDVGFYL